MPKIKCECGNAEWECTRCVYFTEFHCVGDDKLKALVEEMRDVGEAAELYWADKIEALIGGE